MKIRQIQKRHAVQNCCRGYFEKNVKFTRQIDETKQ
jgi:hypothetical protein